SEHEGILDSNQVVSILTKYAKMKGQPSCLSIVEAVKSLNMASARLNIKPAVDILRGHANALPLEEKRAIYDDTEVMLREWDQYLRSGSSQARSLAGFLS